MEDFLPEALALDRQAQMSALLEQRAQEEEAIGEMRGGLERGTSRLREAAQERPRQSRADIDPYRQQHQELQDQRLAELDAMQGQIDQITAEYTQNVTNLRDEALSALENRAPEQAEQAIRTMTKNAAEKKQNIVNQYAQMGLGQDHPAVQAALQQVDEQTMASSADVWQRAAIAHNQMETQVRSNYDNYIQAAEGGRAQARLSGVRAKEQGLYQAQEANRAFAALESSLHQQARQMATQLEAQAAQLEVMGSQALADALRDRTIAWSPIAPLVAANFALQEGDTATGFTTPNVQGYNLNTMFQGGGPTGTGNLSGYESSIHDVLRSEREKQAQKG
jgi:DNA repair exonuclease SbcCD ATPase subunit